MGLGGAGEFPTSKHQYNLLRFYSPFLVLPPCKGPILAKIGQYQVLPPPLLGTDFNKGGGGKNSYASPDRSDLDQSDGMLGSVSLLALSLHAYTPGVHTSLPSRAAVNAQRPLMIVPKGNSDPNFDPDKVDPMSV